MTTTRLRVSEWGASELDLRREVLDLEDDPNVLAALACWNGRSFVIPAGADVWAIWLGLSEMGRDCDSYAEHDRHPETRQHNRWARDGLGGLADRVFAIAKHVPYLIA